MSMTYGSVAVAQDQADAQRTIANDCQLMDPTQRHS